MTTGRVFDVQRCSVHDGPGLRTTVFLAGCNLRCAWCHNPEAFAGATARAMSAQAVLAEVLKDQDFYAVSGGGLTVSGGEPLLQLPFVVELLSLARAHGLHTCVQTAGAVPRAALEAVRPLADLVQLDLKHLDSARHEALTGVGNARVLESAAWLAARPEALELRVPVVPGFTDDEDQLARLAAFLRAHGVPRVTLVPYQRSYLGKYQALGLAARCEHVAPPSPAALESLVARLAADGVAARVAA